MTKPPARTTEEWEALLEGASEGRWVANQYGNVFASVDCMTPDMGEPYDPGREIEVGRFSAHHAFRDVPDPANSRLATPVQEAVAEVVRLRRERITRILEGES